MYSFVSKEQFRERIAYAESILEKYGAVFICESSEIGRWMLSDGTQAYEKIEKSVYKLGKEYIRVDRVYFLQKPCIVLEFADKIEGPYEDADPFPYDLPDDEFENEIRYSLNLI